MNEVIIQELISYVTPFLPSISSVIAVVLLCLKSYKSVTEKISEFVQTKEIKHLISELSDKDKRIEELTTAVEALAVEISKVKPKGYTDDGCTKK